MKNDMRNSIRRLSIVCVFSFIIFFVAGCGSTAATEPLYLTYAYDSPYESKFETFLPYTASLETSFTRMLPSLHISIDAAAVDRRIWQEVVLHMSGSEYDFSAEGRVRGRGNSTWRYMGEKRPYRIRFSEARTMFGSDYIARDWVLLANAIDYSMMRNYAAFYLASMLDSMDFAPTRHFVHLYLNNDYRGVYMLTDQIQVNQGRVEITRHENPARSEYLLEWCRHHRLPDDVYFLMGERNIPFVIGYPRGRHLTDAHVAFAEDFVSQVDAALQSLHFATLANLICLPSFVDFYIVNEFVKNADFGFSSVNFTIRQGSDGPRLVAGPVWDFDQSAGGSYAHWFPDYSPRRMWAAITNNWFAMLVLIPEFREAAAIRWLEIRGNQFPALIERLHEMVEFYQMCFERNFERWPNKLGNYLWRTPFTIVSIPTFVGQAEYLIDWYEQRAIWMDGFLS